MGRRSISSGESFSPDIGDNAQHRDLALLSEAVLAAGMATAHIDESSGIIEFDEDACRILSVPSSLSLVQFLRMVNPADRMELLSTIRNSMKCWGAFPTRSVRLTGRDGEERWIRISARHVFGHCTDSCWVAALFDVTREKAQLETLRQSEDHLRHTVELNPQLPWLADTDGNIISFTDRWLGATGLTRETAWGQGWMQVIHEDDIANARSSVAHSMATGEPLDMRLRIKINPGGYRWMRATAYPRRDEQGKIIRWYGYTEDIHEHVLVEQKIRWTAEHDALTGLPNRMMFNRRLESAIDEALQKLNRVGLLILDVDQFKEVNDLLGHDAGDALLRTFAQCLLGALPSWATIARIGGDEFAVLLPEISSPGDLVAHCNAIFEALKEPFRFGGRNMDCRTSIGAALYPDHGQRSSELMKHADLALYSAKSAGRGRLMVFEPSMHDEMRRRVAMVNRGRTAVEENAIMPYYQPKVSLVTGEIVGFEALLRWRDQKGRLFGPATIAAAFEELDVAEALGNAMMDRVIADVSDWRRKGLNFGHVAINASPAEFRRNTLPERLIGKMEAASIPPREIQVEVTEGVFLGRGAEQAEKSIQMLHDYGIKIALDDFGTGFASLSHLRRFPVDTLKIDRSFVHDIARLTDDAAIVAAIVNLGRNLGMKVVAEGIETPNQAMTLCAQGCEYGQGYLFCKPTAGEDVYDLLTSWNPAGQWSPGDRQNRGIAAA